MKEEQQPEYRVLVVPREDCPGWKFYCAYCQVVHLHGHGLGHRVAHCFKPSPYKKHGYVLVEAPTRHGRLLVPAKPLFFAQKRYSCGGLGIKTPKLAQEKPIQN